MTDDPDTKTVELDLEKSDAGGYGLTPDYLSFRNTYWGQAQPVNYDLLWRMYREDPNIAGSIEVIVNNIIGDGWEIVVGDETEKVGAGVVPAPGSKEADDATRRHVKEVMDRSEMNVALRDIIIQLLVYGDAYMELVRDPNDWSVVSEGRTATGNQTNDSANKDTARMRRATVPQAKGLAMEFEMGESGNIQPSSDALTLTKELAEVGDLSAAKDEAAFAKMLAKYEKRLDAIMGPPKGQVLSFYPRDAKTVRIDYNEHGEVIKYIQRVLHRRVDFWPEEMVHFTLNRVGNRPYGKGPLTTLLYTFQAKQQAEKFTYDFFRRGFMPRLVYIAKNFSKEQLDRLKANIKALQPQEDLVLFGDIEAKQISPSNQDMQFTELLAYLKQNIYIALQVPPVLVGDAALSQSGGRNQSQVQMDAFYKYVKSLKNDIEENLNRKLFTEANFGAKIRFVFKEDNVKEELRRAQQAQLYSSIPYVTPNEIREALHMAPLDGENAELGDQPIFVIQQKQQMEMLEQSAKFAPPGQPGKPGQPGGSNKPGSFKNPNSANPAGSVDRADNAEANNAEAQSDTKKSLSMIGEVAFDRLKDSQSSAMLVQTNTQRVQEGTQSIIPQKTGYEFGATPQDNSERQDASRYVTTRTQEIQGVIANPVSNAFALNTDRQWPADAPVQGGGKPVAGDNKPREFPKDTELERDEVNQAGRPVWVAPDRPKTTATFYRGMNQLEELGLEKKTKKSK